MKRLNRRRFAALATVGTAGGLLTACGNNPDAVNLSPTRIADVANAPTLATNATPPSTGGQQAGTGGEAAGGATAATEASIDAVDINFEPKTLTIAANTDVTITVHNKGVLPHDFHVDKLDITSKLLNSGESDTVTINAAPGTYEFWCTEPGHKEAGMTGTLTILAAGQAEQPQGEQPAGGEAGATEAAISTIDINFEPKTLTIAADTDVKITVTNKGVLQHDFHVDKLDITSKMLNAGDTDTVTVKAAAGTYDFWCTVPGHKEAGMTGTLTVVAGGGGQAQGQQASGEQAQGAQPAAAAGATEATIDTVDINFEPKTLTIAANTDVKINVVNKGVLQHDFHVDKLDITSKMLKSGETDTVTINAAPGTYQFWCTEPGHKESGMTGTLTVVAGGGGGATASGGATPSASPAASAAPAGNGGGGGGGSAAPAEASIDTVDINFEPKTLTIAANTDVTITVHNKGVLQHDFHVDKLDITSKMLNSGDTDTVTVKAAPGTYDFWCTVPGHKEAGMTGTLTVQ